MEQEFDRDIRWSDWRDHRYTVREEWAYCISAAQVREGCTPGTRDQENQGMTLQQFCDRANQHIRQRRAEAQAAGVAVAPKEHAMLSLDETLAVRLYSGPAFQPINAFLRQLAHLTGDHRLAMTRHAELTFAATVRHLCSAIRKLAAVATEEEVKEPLYRGIRGELPRSFWHRDELGKVSATDVGAAWDSNQNTQNLQAEVLVLSLTPPSCARADRVHEREPPGADPNRLHGSRRQRLVGIAPDPPEQSRLPPRR